MASPNYAAEMWRPVPAWEGLYEVSSEGRVRACERGARNRWGPYLRPARMLQPSPVRGYPIVRLKHGDRQRNALVHHLVLEAFVGPAPGRVGKRRGDWQGNHINGCTSDNRAANLEWVTSQGNVRHAVANDLRPHGERVNTAKLTPDDVRAIRRAANRPGFNSEAAGREYGVAGHTIRALVSRRTWRRVE